MKVVILLGSFLKFAYHKLPRNRPSAKNLKKKRVKRMLLNCYSIGMVLTQDITLHCIS